ncbi:hypothetical protein CH362_07730 [Leptospira saintgironsiae]|uniref:DUF1653 domain-containing protein n=2 Tax=Leptospira saintgironsiae TaxID=2023183 RepID=A0A2M9YCD1_9LEPT|nr:hypothetical protein CH362_07730 [Leptospira saintgironsiae]
MNFLAKDDQKYQVKHIKTSRHYYVVRHCMNCTNAQNMIIYRTTPYDTNLYVRYEEEFWKKFEKTS